MNRKILLVYAGKKANIPRFPISVMVLAGYLKKYNYVAEILDTRVQDYKNFDYTKYFCVGISSMSGEPISVGLDVAKIVRKQNPKIPIVWGGVHVSLFPEQSLESEYVDAVVKGEGEIAFLNLLKELENKEQIKKVWDTKFMELDKLDLPSYELIDKNKYSPDTFDYETSRGCPHRCGFCYALNFHKKSWRYKSAKKVIDDLKEVILKYNPKKIVFTDDNFFVDKKRVLKICEGIIKNKLNISWSSTIRADYLENYSDEEMQLLQKSGCWNLVMGAESGSERLLDYICKDITVKNIINATNKCVKFGIVPLFSFIIGLPTETKEELNKTLELYDKLLALDSSVEINGLFIYSAYPGTTLYDGIKNKSLEEWGQWKFNDTQEDKKLKTISTIVRYKFFMHRIKYLPDKFIKEKLGTTKNLIIFKLFNPFLRLSANLRWRTGFFNLAYEWALYDKMRNKIMEYY